MIENLFVLVFELQFIKEIIGVKRVVTSIEWSRLTISSQAQPDLTGLARRWILRLGLGVATPPECVTTQASYSQPPDHPQDWTRDRGLQSLPVQHLVSSAEIAPYRYFHKSKSGYPTPAPLRSAVDYAIWYNIANWESPQNTIEVSVVSTKYHEDIE